MKKFSRLEIYDIELVLGQLDPGDVPSINVTRKLSYPNDSRFGTIVPKRGTLVNWNANWEFPL